MFNIICNSFWDIKFRKLCSSYLFLDLDFTCLSTFRTMNSEKRGCNKVNFMHQRFSAEILRMWHSRCFHKIFVDIGSILCLFYRGKRKRFVCFKSFSHNGTCNAIFQNFVASKQSNNKFLFLILHLGLKVF